MIITDRVKKDFQDFFGGVGDTGNGSATITGSRGGIAMSGMLVIKNSHE